MSSNADKLRKQKQDLERALDSFTRIIGVEAVNHYTKSFERQGFNDVPFRKWKARNPDRDPGRAILVKSGSLRRSIKARNITSTSVTISSDLPYAQIHNDGGRMGNGGTMPQRQFIGESSTLNKKILKTLDAIIKRIFRR